MSEPKPTNHILRNNLLGVLIGAVVAGSLAHATEGGIAAVFALAYGLQVLINLILGFTHLNKGAAPYFLSALLVLLIGFGACSAMVMMTLNIH
jgi:hypothetical protein